MKKCSKQRKDPFPTAMLTLIDTTCVYCTDKKLSLTLGNSLSKFCEALKHIYWRGYLFFITRQRLGASDVEYNRERSFFYKELSFLVLSHSRVSFSKRLTRTASHFWWHFRNIFKFSLVLNYPIAVSQANACCNER